MPQETLTYHAPEALAELTLAELEALWELVPTQRQKQYADRLAREVRLQGAQGSDHAELQVIAGYLERYSADGLVPVGARWVKVPKRVLEAAQAGQALVMPENIDIASPRRINPMFFMGLGMLMLICLMGFVLMRGGGDESLETTPTLDTSMFSPTPRRSPTPTPIALVESDAVIREGDIDRALAYPIGLQILPNPNDQPRVFIVQRRKVELAEWNYDTNADTASFLSDLPVQMVIGIPYADENSALFANLQEGAVFVLRLNTGGELRFVFTSKQKVSRSDTHFFRQVTPGLVLVLIGETGDDGLPTGERWVINATYLSEQELSRDGLLAADAGLPTPVPTLPLLPSATPLPTDPRSQLSVTLIEESIQTHVETHTLITRLRIYNPQTISVELRPEDFRLALGYAPDPPGPWANASTFQPMTLLPGQAVDVTLYWQWQGEPYSVLEVLAYKFAFHF